MSEFDYCGCGDFHSDAAIEIGDKVLSVDVYPGCDNCNNPAGVELTLFDPKEASSWGVLEYDQLSDVDQLFVPFLTADDLLVAYKDIGAAIGGEEGYKTFEEYLTDHGTELIALAIIGRCSKNFEEKRKAEESK